MKYTPTVWETGDTITAEKLNKAECGIAAVAESVLTVTVTYGETEMSLNKKMGDILTAITNGVVTLINIDAELGEIDPSMYKINYVGRNDDDGYYVSIIDSDATPYILRAATLDDYPSASLTD